MLGSVVYYLPATWPSQAWETFHDNEGCSTPLFGYIFCRKWFYRLTLLVVMRRRIRRWVRWLDCPYWFASLTVPLRILAFSLPHSTLWCSAPTTSIMTIWRFLLVHSIISCLVVIFLLSVFWHFNYYFVFGKWDLVLGAPIIIESKRTHCHLSVALIT